MALVIALNTNDTNTLRRVAEDAAEDSSLILSGIAPHDTDKTLATNVRVILSILRDAGVIL